MSRYLATAGILLALAAAPVSAATSMIHLSGCSFETGGFPDSNLGDQLCAVGSVTSIRQPLFWSPRVFSYTWCADGMMSLGETVIGATHIVEYSGGILRVHVDALPSNAEYGVNPPNTTSPASFADGSAVYLEGAFTSLVMTMNTATGSGSISGALMFYGGNAYPQLQDPEGWTVGAQISRVMPKGYDCSWNAALYVDGPTSVEGVSWSNIKAMYR